MDTSIIIDPQGRCLAFPLQNYSVGQLMRALRCLQGKSQKETAEALGLRQPQYSSMERDETRIAEKYISTWCSFVSVEESSFRILLQQRSQ